MTSIPGEEICYKWLSVNFTDHLQPICGTLFLSSHGSDGTVLQWIADHGLISEDHVLPQIPISSLSSVDRRRMGVNRRYSCIFLRTKKQELYGPFEFIKGGSRDFIAKLRMFIDLQQTSSDPDVYKVTKKTCTYQLPTADYSTTPMIMIQGMGTKIINALDNLRVSADSALTSAGVIGPNTVFRTNDHRCPSPGNYGFLEPDVSTQALGNIFSDRLHFESVTSSVESDGYQLISHELTKPVFFTLPDLVPVRRRSPLTMSEWQGHLDRDGRVTVVEKLQASIYYGGIEANLRPIVWKYLFGYLKWDFTTEENAKRIEEKRRHYHVMKNFWKHMTHEQMKNFRVFRERKSIIEKDTYRTDRKIPFFRDNSTGVLSRLYNILMTYIFYNIDLGYFQGMNDLLAIVMTVIDDEEDAFWCFVGLLERLSDHFSDGPSSLSNQFLRLFELIDILMPRFAQFLRDKEATSMNYCFKWFLVIFKREFSYDDVKILWEALWSGCAPRNFQLLIAVAIFDTEADSIMRTCGDVSQILQYVNGLSENINLQRVLSRAQGIYDQLTEVKDHLPVELAIALGFKHPPPISVNVDEDFLPIEECDFSQETPSVDRNCGEGSTAVSEDQHCQPKSAGLETIRGDFL